jgi:hypothetical protein
LRPKKQVGTSQEQPSNARVCHISFVVAVFASTGFCGYRESAEAFLLSLFFRRLHWRIVMKLLAPELVGPLSQCSTRLRIRGNIAGASLVIAVNGVDSATHVSKYADGVYVIGVALQPNDVVVVRQTLANDVSETSLPITVQAAPSQISAVTLQSKLYACARRLWVSGGVPGAIVSSQIGNQTAGSAELVAGVGVFDYDPVLSVAETMAIKQATCTNVSQSQTSPAAIAQPSPIPAPTIEGPLIECQTTLTIANVLDGAYVEFYRDGSLEKTFTFASAREWRAVKELKKNQKIEVRQGFKCKKQSPTLESFSEKSSATVQGVDALKAPKFLATPCPKTTYITLGSLIPGARVVLTVDDVELGQTDAPDTTYTFQVPPLSSGATVKAWMQLCKKDGPKAQVVVSKNTNEASGLEVSKLFSCAAYVFVKVYGTSGNYLLYLTNKAGQQISAYHTLIGFEKLIPVSPSLTVNDEVTVNVLGCGGSWKKYGPFSVSAGTPPPSEFIEPIEAGTNYASVLSDHAGAWVDAYVNNQWAGATISKGDLGITTVAFAKQLKTGDSVYGTQTLCGKTGKPSKTVKVQKARPKRPELLEPTDGATGINTQPVFKWKDPSAGLENAAESYRLIVKKESDSSETVNTTTSATNLQSPLILAYDASYRWKVESLNSTGTSGFANWFTFGTSSPPVPQEANLHFDSDILSNPPGFSRNTPIELQVGITNSGEAASGGYTVEFQMSYHNGGGLIDVVSSDFPSLDGGESVTILSIPVTIPTGTIRLDAYLLQGGNQIDSAFRII